MIRGHIRNSFNDDQLYNLVKDISKKNSIKIYIHTWNILQSNVSWRKMDRIDINVNENLIKKYFRDLSKDIQQMIIEDDRYIKLEGDTHGMISLSQCPKIAWKNMWYGKKQIIDVIKKDIIDIDEPIVNIRFDIFSNSNSFNHNFISKIIENKSEISNKIIFAFDKEFMGVDNFYIGNLNTMVNLIYNFHYNLDSILQRHYVFNQEYIVFRENRLMNI